jgi:hypothetical protein
MQTSLSDLNYNLNCFEFKLSLPKRVLTTRLIP